MSAQLPSGIRAFEEWLSAGAAEAETLAPHLLELRGPLLLREVRMRPELRTAGVLQRLLAAARNGLHASPERAHEITTTVARYARSIEVPADLAFVSRTIQGEAWREHARVLGALGRSARAARAIRRARRCFEDVPARDWHLATADLVEAPLLHDRGLRTEALRMLRSAAHRFRLSCDHDHYVEARWNECWMLWDAGDRAAAGKVWTSIAAIAKLHGDAALAARVAERIGGFELLRGSTRDGHRLLTGAVELFDTTPVSDAAVRTRWSLARAAAALGRIPSAISEYHKVRALLLKQGFVTEAAIAAAEVLELHVLGERESQLPSLTTTFVRLFHEAGATANTMAAFAYLQGRAHAGLLTHEDVAAARTFFQELRRRPRARFARPHSDSA